MKHILIVLSAIGIFASALGQSKTDEIKVVLQQMKDAYEKNNINLLSSWYHPDLIFTFNDGARFSREQLIPILKADSVRTKSGEFTDVLMIADDQYAYVSLIENITTTSNQDGSVQRYSGRYSKFFVRENGKWMLIAQQITDLPSSSRKAIKLEDVAIKRFEGSFQGENGKIYKLKPSGGDLILMVDGQELPFHPYDKNKFFMDDGYAVLEFLSVSNTVTHVILRVQDRDNMVLVKMM